MKKTIYIAIVLSLLPVCTLANPNGTPGRIVGGMLIIFVAFMMEITVTTGYLIVVGMAAGPVVVALLILNFMTYVGVMLPSLDLGVPTLVIEVLIVTLEAVIIKGLALFFPFQGDTFTILKWRHAFIAAALGNLLSYGVGRMLV